MPSNSIPKLDNAFQARVGYTTHLRRAGDWPNSQSTAEADLYSKPDCGAPCKLITPRETTNVDTAHPVHRGPLDHAPGRRLINFLEGGNRYSGAVASCEGGAVNIIVRETYQDPK